MKKFTFLFSFILLISVLLPKHGNTQNFETDSLALVELYNDCNGTNWTGFDTWLNGPLSTWEGITLSSVKNEAGTDSTMRVTGISLKSMTLTGTLPDELGNLTEMAGKIELLDQPGLTGTLPASFWNWTNVTRFQVKRCGFTDIDVSGMEKMVNLYEFNTQATPFVGEVPVEIFELPLMRDIYLEDGMWSSLPADLPIPTATPLRRFYLNGNQFAALPDFAGMVWASGTKVKFQNNMLAFEDLVPNMWIADDDNVTFTYSPQAVVGDDMYSYAAAGTSVTLESGIDSLEGSVYTWFKESVDADPVGETKDLVLAAFDPAMQSGKYFCVAQNTSVPDLNIYSANKMVFENGNSQDSLALVELYNDCNGTNWTGFDTWLNGPLSTWEGITLSSVKNEAGTDSTMRVTGISLKSMTLTGTLPDELGNLTEMAGKIELLDQPGLTGTLPAFFWNWTNVTRFQVKRCGFTDIDVSGMEKMVNLYEINTQATPFVGEVPVEIFELPLMRDIYLEDGMWSSLPADLPIPTATPLRRFYLNGNQFTALPDFTGMVWASGTKVKFQNNMLTFEDLVPNMSIAADENVTFTYSPQAVVGDDMFTYAAAGTSVTIESGIDSVAGSVYVWFKESVDADPVGETKDLVLAAFDPAMQSGKYFCVAQNTNVPDLNIYTANKMLFESELAQDSLALVALYNDCNGVNWTGFDNWLVNDTLSAWEGVTLSWVKNEAGTDSTMRVTGISLKSMTLTGMLPDELGNLTEMAGKIELLDQPGLTGTLPASFWNWTNVTRFQVKRCGFTDIDVSGMEKMVNLYEFNSEATPFVGEIPVELFELPLMRDIYLEDGMWSSLPTDFPIPTPTPLRRFYLNGNQFADLPDFTGMVWASGSKVKFQNNMLTFEDLEPNMWIADDENVTFTYSPQALLTVKDAITLIEGDLLELYVNCGGTQNVYTWLKDGVVIEGADSDSLMILSTVKEDSGEYQCVVQNTLVMGLDLASDTFSVVVNFPVGADFVEKSFFRVNGNPVRDVLSIDSEDVIEYIIINDIAGRTMKHELVNSTNIRMNVSDLHVGIYVVRLIGQKEDSVLKIIKE